MAKQGKYVEVVSNYTNREFLSDEEFTDKINKCIEVLIARWSMGDEDGQVIIEEIKFTSSAVEGFCSESLTAYIIYHYEEGKEDI